MIKILGKDARFIVKCPLNKQINIEPTLDRLGVCHGWFFLRWRSRAARKRNFKMEITAKIGIRSTTLQIRSSARFFIALLKICSIKLISDLYTVVPIKKQDLARFVFLLALLSPYKWNQPIHNLANTLFKLGYHIILAFRFRFKLYNDDFNNKGIGLLSKINLLFWAIHTSVTVILGHHLYICWKTNFRIIRQVQIQKSRTQCVYSTSINKI